MPPIPKSNYRLISPINTQWSHNQIFLYREIISFVNKIDSFKSPKLQLEQYTLPSDLIALILILAASDLNKHNVVDLGCGTGRITLPVKKFFSPRVLGVDVDFKVIKHLERLREQHNLDVDLLISPVEFLETFNWSNKFHTTIMNPPFGTKRRKLDLVFLKQALKYSKSVISIHKSNPDTRTLVKQLGKQFGKKVQVLASILFPQDPIFHFHFKARHLVRVDLFRFTDQKI
ncbi:MAG: METTL5 family protein [Candidatus Hodarchaeales archaeon]